VTDARGLTTTYAYDALNRLAGATFDIYIKPRGGSGPGEPTGLNINNF